jgi:hypothetical protein
MTEGKADWTRRAPKRFHFLAVAVFSLALGGCEDTRTTFLDSAAERDAAFTALRGSIGGHPRVLRIRIEPLAVTIEAQDPQNPGHVDRYRYIKAIVRTIAGSFAFSHAATTEPVALQLINPNLEQNLFDYDAVRLSATTALEAEAVRRAALQDPAHVAQMEIARQAFILPKPGSGEIRWSVEVESGRERATIVADPQGQILGADLSGTLRAQNLDILKEPALVAHAVEDFRTQVGAGAVLTSVRIESTSVGFHTSLRDRASGLENNFLPVYQVYTWNLNGLARRMGAADARDKFREIMHKERPQSFSVNDIDWTSVGKLQGDAIKAAGLAQAHVEDVAVERDEASENAPPLAWKVRVVDPGNGATTVVADLHGAVMRVEPPSNRKPAP